jgi:hypothetical protein
MQEEEEREVRRVEDQQREDAEFRKRSREFGYVVNSRHEKVIYVDNEPMSELQRQRGPAKDEDEDGVTISDQYHDAKPVIERATEEGVWSHRSSFSAPLSLLNCCALSLNRHRELHLR